MQDCRSLASLQQIWKLQCLAYIGSQYKDHQNMVRFRYVWYLNNWCPSTVIWTQNCIIHHLRGRKRQDVLREQLEKRVTYVHGWFVSLAIILEESRKSCKYELLLTYGLMHFLINMKKSRSSISNSASIYSWKKINWLICICRNTCWD
jgi:hypothetical protein